MSIPTLPGNVMPFTADYTRREYDIEAPRGSTIEDFLRPAFWAHYVIKLKAGHIVTVRWPGQCEVRLRCEDVAKGFAVMQVAAVADYAELRKRAIALSTRTAFNPADAVAETGKAKAFPCVDHKKATGWRVLGFDGSTVVEGLATEADAKDKLREYVARANKAA